MKLIIYDETQGLLTLCWRIGAALMVMLGRADRAFGVSEWEGFFRAALDCDGTIARLEFWGHGHSGGVSINGVALADAHELGRLKSESKMAAGALLWWRTCSAFRGAAGHQFALDCAWSLGCRVAGHTFVIWLWQAGLHVLEPGATPGWDVAEGGSWSLPWSPSSVFMLSKGPTTGRQLGA